MPDRIEENPICLNASTKPTSVELRVLLACARPSPGLEIDSLLSESIEWNYLLKMASWHGILGLLSRTLAKVPDKVPDSVRRFLAECESLITRRNLLLSSELLRISEALTDCGVRHLVYKGMVLSEYLYGSIALRTSSDIDLLVRPEDRIAAIACLEQLGFSETYGLSPYRKAAAIRFGFEHTFVRDGVNIDLHWHLVQQYAWNMSTGTIWNNTVPFTFLGRTVQIFSPEFTLASLSVHSAQHEWAHLKMFADIARLISRNTDLNWDAIEAFVPDTHSKRSLKVALKLVHTNLNVTLPPDVLKRIDADKDVIRIAKTIQEKSWPSACDPVPSHLDFKWMLIRTEGEAPRDRLRYLCGTVFLPTLADFQATPLPGPLHWLYFVLRPARILWQRLAAVIRIHK